MPWATLLKLLSRGEGEAIERMSRSWPSVRQRRLRSAILYLTRQRWPYDPYTATELSIGFKYQTLAAVYDLSGGNRPRPSQSTV